MSAVAEWLSEPELIVDLFAGGGGASAGIESALNRPVDIAVNHSAVAIAAHERNHPNTKHYREDVWRVDPREVCAGRSVGLLWASPACTHFSRAKGGTNPRSGKIRSLAWVVNRWAREVKPRVIMLENVEEFADWGPLDNDGLPNAAKRGLTFKHWLGKLRAQGYVVEYRSLIAADYGTPTTRKRLFLIARCDGQPIVWPHATHSKEPSLFAKPWRSAAECIDFALPCPSIFARKKPLAEATLRRIAAGIVRYVIRSASPFLVSITHQGGNRVHSLSDPLKTVTCANRGEFALVAPHIAKYYGAEGSPNSQQSAEGPLHTITTRDKFSLVAASMVVNTSSHAPRSVDDPLATVTTGGHHILSAATLIKYHNKRGDRGHSVEDPLHTVDTENRYGLVAAHITKFRTGSSGADIESPMPTVTANGFVKRPGGAAPLGMVAASSRTGSA